ncbi:Abi family protein [Cryomorpha ignava]|uniref:Abi family protein n=1 Tax=Cryomorpha ignava TaxID=101383 RepID=UPI00293BE038|nr:Abi family protein [Cryomorpha ignava]
MGTAKEFLRNISYFRLQGFWWEFHIDKENHKFRAGIRFETIINLYTFDSKFRLILFDALERIEVAIRTKLVYYLSIELGQWWIENESNFYSKEFHQESLSEIDKELSRTKEIFIKSHYRKYGDNYRPPAYKTLEIVSFGCLSKLYSNLNHTIKAKDRIAKEFNLPNHHFLRSWLKTFNIVRNIITHHSRIWNRNIDSPPRLLYKTEYDFIDSPKNENSMYHCMSYILYILNKVSAGHGIKERIIILIEDSDFINLTEMGIPDDWRDQNIWK